MDDPMAVCRLNRIFEGESELLGKSRPKEARDQIKAFLEYGMTYKGWSGHRKIYYSVRLRITLGFLGEKFLNPDSKDIQNMVKSPIDKGNNDRTVSDYLDEYKRSLKWKYETLNEDLTKAFEFKPTKNNKNLKNC